MLGRAASGAALRSWVRHALTTRTGCCSPKKIISILRDKKRFTKGRPDLSSQYGLLVEKMVGRPVKESNGNWNFYVNDNTENMKALTIAAETLEHGERREVLASVRNATGSSPAKRWSFPPAAPERHTGCFLPARPGWAEARQESAISKSKSDIVELWHILC